MIFYHKAPAYAPFMTNFLILCDFMEKGNSLLYNQAMKKKTVAIGSALILGLGLYIGSQSSSLPSSERSNFAMRAKDLIRKINRKEFEACLNSFDETLKESMPPEKMQDIFGPALEILGDFYRFKYVSVVKREGPSKAISDKNNTDKEITNQEKKDKETLDETREPIIICTVRCEYKNSPAIFTIYFDENYRVSGIHLE